MSHADAFLIAAAITFGCTVCVTAYVHRPLKRLLPELCGTPEYGAFWMTIVDVILLLTSLTALLLGRANATMHPTYVGLEVADLLWAPAVGLVVAVFLIGMIVAVLSNSEPTWQAKVVNKEQSQDLKRLLSKVDSVRARELVIRESENG